MGITSSSTAGSNIDQQPVVVSRLDSYLHHVRDPLVLAYVEEGNLEGALSVISNLRTELGSLFSLAGTPEEIAATTALAELLRTVKKRVSAEVPGSGTFIFNINQLLTTIGASISE